VHRPALLAPRPIAAGLASRPLQRYLDAGKCFNFILTYISK
jgi:hypothetical protein